MTFAEFLLWYMLHHQNKPDFWREGQFLFNVLYFGKDEGPGYNQRVANLLRGTRLDPFYKDSIPDETWNFIAENWEA